jgi:hypothetical protein
MGVTPQDGTKWPYRNELWWTMKICTVMELPAGLTAVRIKSSETLKKKTTVMNGKNKRISYPEDTRF